MSGGNKSIVMSDPKTHKRALDESSNLDFLRSSAVILVLLDHILEAIGIKLLKSFHPWDWYLGRLGVLLFFVHTSFVLMSSLERIDLSGRNIVYTFYLRRFFRIYPLSTVVVIAVLCFQIPDTPWGEFHWLGLGTLFSNITLTMNLTRSDPMIKTLWTLPLEIQMYLVLPIAYVLLRRFPAVLTIIVLWAISVLVGIIQWRMSDRLSIAQFGPCFLGGVFAWVLHGRNIPRFSPWLWPPTLGAFLFLYVSVEQLDSAMHPSPLAWAFCLALGLTIPIFRDIPSGVVQRSARTIAKYSFGIYLWHFPALWIGCFVLGSIHPALQITAALTALITLPVVSYHLLEEPFINYGRTLVSSPEK
jgi:peptidoglycan/LPS O-acetylase OafA/YrhL